MNASNQKIRKELQGKKRSKAVRILMGILNLIPWVFFLDLAWHEVLKTAIGGIAPIIGFFIKKEDTIAALMIDTERYALYFYIEARKVIELGGA